MMMMMSSKLTYLSKYGGNVPPPTTEVDDACRSEYKRGRKSKSNKKSKTKARSNESGDHRNHSSTLRDLDDIQPFLRAGDDNDNDVLLWGDDDEGPAVVNSSSELLVSGSFSGRGFEKVTMENEVIDNNTIIGSTGAQRCHRHDSDDSDAYYHHNNRTSKRDRHDSESDMSSTKHAMLERNSRNTKRERDKCRHDSDSEDDEQRRKRQSTKNEDTPRRSSSLYSEDDDHYLDRGASRVPSQRWRRHDSDSEDMNTTQNKRDLIRAKRMYKERARNYVDSDSDEHHKLHAKIKKQPRRRHDSESTDDGDGNRDSARQRLDKTMRHDSDSESRDYNIRKHSQERNDDSSDKSENSIPHRKVSKRMSSGHKSGLQKSQDFARAEEQIRKRKRDELAQFNLQNGNIGSGETVYRDASGKKRTASAMHDEERLRRKAEEKEALQRQANKGRYQQLQEEHRLRELEEAANMTLARGIEDEQLEERKRSVIREGDPMAMHEWKKQQAMQSKESVMKGNEAATLCKPIYKGPQPKPNRFNIRPGYRWDGIDRGNGFEDRVLEMLHSRGRKKEEAYKWSAADM